jgi:hypothetical protein
MTPKHNQEQDKLMQQNRISKASPGGVPVPNFAEGQRRRRSMPLLRHRQALHQVFQNNRIHLLVTPIVKREFGVAVLIEKSMPSKRCRQW